MMASGLVPAGMVPSVLSVLRSNMVMLLARPSLTNPRPNSDASCYPVDSLRIGTVAHNGLGIGVQHNHVVPCETLKPSRIRVHSVCNPRNLRCR